MANTHTAWLNLLVKGHTNSSFLLEDPAALTELWGKICAVIKEGNDFHAISIASALIVMLSRRLHRLPKLPDVSNDECTTIDFGHFRGIKPLPHAPEFLALPGIESGSFILELSHLLQSLLEDKSRLEQLPDVQTAVCMVSLALACVMQPSTVASHSNAVMDVISMLIASSKTVDDVFMSSAIELLRSLVTKLYPKKLDVTMIFSIIERICKQAMYEIEMIGLTVYPSSIPWCFFQSIIACIVDEKETSLVCNTPPPASLIDLLSRLIDASMWTYRQSLEEADLYLSAILIAQEWQDVRNAPFTETLVQVIDEANERDVSLNELELLEAINRTSTNPTNIKAIMCHVLDIFLEIPRRLHLFPLVKQQLEKALIHRFKQLAVGGSLSAFNPLFRFWWICCESGNDVLAKAILDSTPPNLRSKLLKQGDEADDKRNCFFKACQRKKVNLVKFLHSQNSDLVRSVSNQGMTVLHVASVMGYTEMVKLLLGMGLSVNSRDSENFQPLHIACQAGHTEVAELLLKAGADIHDARNEDGTAPIHFASESNKPELLELLIKHGVDVNQQETDGCTALHYVAQTGFKLEMLQVLVKHGANVRLEDEDGMLPIHIAAEAGRVDAFKVLKEHGADIFERTDDQSTCLHLAVAANRLEMVKYLINEEKFDVNIKNRMGETALHAACLGGNVDIVRELLPHISDINAIDSSQGFSPLMFAARNGNIEIMSLLIEHGALVNMGKKRQSALHVACRFGNEEAAAFLIAKGANVTAKDRKKRTPFDVIELDRVVYQLIARDVPELLEMDLSSNKCLEKLDLAELATALQHNNHLESLSLGSFKLAGDKSEFTKALARSNFSLTNFAAKDMQFTRMVFHVCTRNRLLKRLSGGVDGLIHSLVRSNARSFDAIQLTIGQHTVEISKTILLARHRNLLKSDIQQALKHLPNKVSLTAVRSFVRWIIIGALPYDASVYIDDILNDSDLRNISFDRYLDMMRELMEIAAAAECDRLQTRLKQMLLNNPSADNFGVQCTEEHIFEMKEEYSQLVSDYLSLLQTGEGADFVLASKDGIELKVHKNILALRWPWFSHLISAGMKEAQEGRVVLPSPDEPMGMSGATMRGLVRYLYCGDCSELEGPDNCRQLMGLIDYFGFDEYPQEHGSLLMHLNSFIETM